jgi:hypothetical protein
VFLGNGDGTFQAATEYSATAGAQTVAVADFNADGAADLAVGAIGFGACVLLGNGNGTFQAGVIYPGGNNPANVAAGDFNGDGRPDVAVANYYDGGPVGIFLGAVGHNGTLACYSATATARSARR